MKRSPADVAEAKSDSAKRPRSTVRVGIVGYGAIGQYLAEQIIDRADLELAFVWNRTGSKVSESSVAEVKNAYLESLDAFAETNPDIVVEVAHPSISVQYGPRFLEHCDFFIGSPTALADSDVSDRLKSIATRTSNTLFLPCGALWGALDMQKMAALGKVTSFEITMRKAPGHLKLKGELLEKLEKLKASPQFTSETLLYEGPVRHLAPMAPNNVNTMCVAAMACGLGLDQTIGRLTVDPALEAHVIDYKLCAGGFELTCRRYNPAKKKATTGSATFGSFWSSLLRAIGSKSSNQNPVQIV